ncbi:MAG: hypothetical protein KatS3mg121_0814 [Gammaproteobacteria bacterium]|nr:MAG: hypothetical protein KatS3mg121_0814 [Gammaproteobacteria bacterium]
MHRTESDRIQLINVLWALKQTGVRHRLEGAQSVSLSALIRDSALRAEFIERALHGEHPELVALARRAAQLDRAGVLSTAPTPAAAVRPGGGWTAAARGAVLATVLVALVGGALGLLFALGLLPPGHRLERVSGSIYDDRVWHADTVYLLEGIVYLEGTARLRIEPGTRVLGQPGSALVVTRHATLEARGTPGAPIVFTSARPPGSRRPGDWGGLMLLGNAPVNRVGAMIEGLPIGDPRGAYGGGDPDHVCGVLEYVRIEFAGYEAFRDNELNGLTLAGCGLGTRVRHVQVHRALDDGVEIFGGTVTLSHVLITQPGDDGLDWDEGWTGAAQFVIVQFGAERGDNAIEADNRADRHDAQPRSAPSLANVTLLGAPESKRIQRGMVLRHGTGADIRNLLAAGLTGEIVDVRNRATARVALDGGLGLRGALLAPGPGPAFPAERGAVVGLDGRPLYPDAFADDDDGFDEAAFFTRPEGRLEVSEASGLPPTAFDPAAPRFRPEPLPALRALAVALPDDGFWDEGARHLGAVRPEGPDWTVGWTAYPLD